MRFLQSSASELETLSATLPLPPFLPPCCLGRSDAAPTFAVGPATKLIDVGLCAVRTVRRAICPTDAPWSASVCVTTNTTALPNTRTSRRGCHRLSEANTRLQQQQNKQNNTTSTAACVSCGALEGTVCAIGSRSGSCTVGLRILMRGAHERSKIR